ncbi:glycoside hydrolase family 2 TIM barrel-domain containing protein [Propionibacteriaceae bacterium Y1923]|uniref:glycoside hydrolase family 2 TIM barrel-domain containing protein n=1 Tax=Aestuariimicrobium sp. Y1814 TaxID=3418742 RepID=UPI003C16CAF6
MTVDTGLDEGVGTVGYTVDTRAAEGLGVRVVLRDEDGIEVATAEGHRGELTVADVRPWRPLDAYLYDLEVQVVDGDDVVDSFHQAVGVRTVEVRGTQFLINGEPFHFKGFGMHEDHVTIGKHRPTPLVRWGSST